MEALWMQITVPVLLIIIMMSMGLELVPADFRRIVEMPKPVIIGLVGQLLLLPCLGIFIAHGLDLPPKLATGVMIIVCCPGGAPSNIFTYLAGANLALSITLTALSSVLTVITIPLWISFASQHFLGEEDQIQLPLARTFLQLLVVALLPIAAGMLVRHRSPDWAERWRGPIKRAMAVLFVVATLLIVGSQWESVVRDFPIAAKAALCLVLIALVLGYGAARLFGLVKDDAFTISIEVSLQNGALATLIVVNLLKDPELLIFPGTYALLAFFPVGLWAIVYRTRNSAAG